jgi:hypothetical protein
MECARKSSHILATGALGMYTWSNEFAIGRRGVLIFFIQDSAHTILVKEYLEKQLNFTNVYICYIQYGTCSIHEGNKKCIQNLASTPMARQYLKRPRNKWKNNMQMVLKRQAVKIRTELN